MLQNNRMIKTNENNMGRNRKALIGYANNKTLKFFWRDASFTAEASLLFPIILFLVFTVIYACFYLYDGVLTVSSVHTAAERAAYGQIWNTEDNEEVQKGYTRELLTKFAGGILVKASDVRIEKRFGRLKIQADLKRTGPAKVLRMIGLSADTDYETVKRRTDPAELTRISDVLWNAGKSAADKLREAR